VRKTLRIATRASALALWQAEHVAQELKKHHPYLETEVLPMTTRGDQFLDQSLATIGGKGLFLKELEVALKEQRADIAVHSLKDVPMELESGFTLTAILPRANPFDAFISNHYSCVEELPLAARVGTSSLRRQAQLRAFRPDLQIRDLRGNVNTRLAKLDANQYDALILACAGLERLNLKSRIGSELKAPDWLPGVGQGAIAVECCESSTEVTSLLAPLNDKTTARCTNAERAMSRHLHGNCQVPIAAYCTEDETGALTLEGLVGDSATGLLIRAGLTSSKMDPESVGVEVAKGLLERGANKVLNRRDIPPSR